MKRERCGRGVWAGVLATVLALGCGGGETGTSGTGGSTSTSTSSVGTGGAASSSSSAGGGGATSSTSTSTTGTGTGGAGGGGSAPIPPACYNTCNAAADCATPGTPIYDVDNWACTAGVCDYKGCKSTKECTDTFQKPNYVCSTTPGYPIKFCNNTCNAAADCATPGTPIYDVDNWACTAGVCDYKGCKSTKECTDTFQKPNYVCTTTPGYPIKFCNNTCNAAADCATPGTPIYDLDNWACTAGICDYKGCKSTKECTDTFQKPNYVCQ